MTTKQIISPGAYFPIEGTDIEIGVNVGHNVALDIEEFSGSDGRPYIQIVGQLDDGSFAIRIPKESVDGR